MKKSVVFLASALAVFTGSSTTSVWANSLENKIQSTLDKHYESYREKEFFSAIQLSTKVGDREIKTYVVGTTSHKSNSPPVDVNNLFEIGSITKSFTSALLLQAEAEGKVGLGQDFTTYLTEYGRWQGLTITQLLNMTSGLPNYTESSTIGYNLVTNPERVWTDQELMNIVYPQENLTFPPLNTGYAYTNTGYIFSALILEKAYGQTYRDLVEKKLLEPLKLENTFYPVPSYPQEVKERMVSSNNFNPYNSPELSGQQVDDVNLSWAGAAGGLVANSEDIIHWVRALFVEDKLLSPAQKIQLTQIVSTETGKPITGTTAEDSEGFGLGVVQLYDKDWGHYWVYQGETVGYRSFYVYFPCNKVVISALLNSAVDSQNNHARLLLTQVYQSILEDNPALVCRSN